MPLWYNSMGMTANKNILDVRKKPSWILVTLKAVHKCVIIYDSHLCCTKRWPCVLVKRLSAIMMQSHIWYAHALCTKLWYMRMILGSSICNSKLMCFSWGSLCIKWMQVCECFCSCSRKLRNISNQHMNSEKYIVSAC